MVAFGDSFSFAHVVDFGVWPDQKGWHKIRKEKYNVDMQHFYRDGTPEEKICFGIRDCLYLMLTRKYYDYEGKPIDVHDEIPLLIGREKQRGRFLAVIGVDARDKDQEEAAWSGIASFNETADLHLKNRAIPCYGEPTKTRHMRNFDNLKLGEYQRGNTGRWHDGEGDWIEFPKTKEPLTEKYGSAVHSCLMFEANTYRTMRDTAWKTAIGERGCQTIFDDLPEILQMYCEQQCSMVAMPGTNIPGSEYKQWVKRKPEIYDKEFFDTNSGSWMLASYCGLNPDYGVTIPEPAKPAKPKGSWLDRYRT